jgi:hypothetical protein
VDSAETDVLIISFVTASSNPSALHVLDGLKLNQSLETASAAGVTIMFAPISFAEGYREITSEPYGILKGVVDGKAFVRGAWRCCPDRLSPPDNSASSRIVVPVGTKITDRHPHRLVRARIRMRLFPWINRSTTACGKHLFSGDRWLPLGVRASQAI